MSGQGCTGCHAHKAQSTRALTGGKSEQHSHACGLKLVAIAATCLGQSVRDDYTERMCAAA